MIREIPLAPPLRPTVFLRSFATARSLVLVALSFCIAGVCHAQAPSSARYQNVLAKAVRGVAQDALPAVVTIEVIGVMQADGEVRQDAPTSGVVIDEMGHVLTSSWVTGGDSASIIVNTPSGKRYPATVVAQDEHRDLVLLKVSSSDETWQPIEFPATDQTIDQVGETMVAVARYGEANTPMVSTGILSAVGRLDGTAIQTDARISPAFYGGPLIDLKGHFRGIVIPAVGEGGAEESTAWYDSGIAFAIPSSIIAEKLDQLRRGNNIQQGLLGFVVAGSDPYAEGTELSVVRKRSPADKAGLKVGDQVQTIGGQKVTRRQEIKLALGQFDAGDDVEITYQRDGKSLSTIATMVATIPPLQPQFIGLIATDEVMPESNEADSVVVQSVWDQSPADGVLKPNDRLIQLDGSPILNTNALRQRLWASEPETAMELTIEREGKTQTVSIDPLTLDGPLDRIQAHQTSDNSAADDWNVETLQLPDITNTAAIWFPQPAADAATASDETPSTPLALAIVLAPPKDRDPSTMLDPWKDLARQHRVAVCVICSDADDQWRPNEIDAITKLTAASLKQSGASPSAVSLIGGGAFTMGEKANPADSMALGASLSTENVFSGVAISNETEPPAIRIRKDGPPRLLRVLIPSPPNSEMPFWAATLRRIGCPLQTTLTLNRDLCLQWTRSLLTM
ncbi:PDZ domain-containing protein [Rhodopirellula sp. P2]|uniref:PDZ domain-containing protein n=1 Tax=Rhodopirellula sp. P2 TaxID=2127060 RepID=UPI0023677D0B|nr:PDZ domain-containing protein [Rhodopirellula sp. P2]WDQ18647.1 PDZ domain-containing protein [Rhodopirellula sp. P2]